MASPTPRMYKQYVNDAEKAKAYNHRLATAEQDFDKWRAQAKEWWDRYENVPKSAQASAKGLVVNVPTGTATVDALFSSLTAIEVDFICQAMGHATPEQALLAQTALNAEWQRLHADEDRDDAIKDSLVTGIGWMKVGYDFFEEEETVARDPDALREEINALIQEALDAGLEAPNPEQIAKLVPDTETVKTVLRDHICVDYVPWDTVRWDPTARRWKDVRWIAQLTKLPLDEVRTNPLYREYAKRSRNGLRNLDGIKADSTLDRDLLVTGKPLEDDARVTVVEMWDLETGTVCTFVKGATWLLHEGVNPFAIMSEYCDRSPFVPMVLRKTTRRVRGVSDMDLMLRSLNEKNLYRSRTATYIERIVPKLMGPEDALTEEGKAALTSSEIGAYVSTSREVEPSSIVPLTAPQLPAEAFDMNDRIDNEIREATGISDLQRGLFPQRRVTATATQEVAAGAAARQSEKRNTLERFHTEVARRMLHLMQMFYEQERMLRYVDPSLGNVPWAFTASDIIGDFDIRVTLEPKESPTREQQRQEATVALNVLGPLAQGGIIDPTALVAWFMRKYGFTTQDINELVNSPQEQQQVQAQQLALQQASAEAGQAAQGVPPPVSPDVVAGALGGSGPGTPGAVRDLANSAGVAR